jgi:uncharacterized RDD family membrane protein YckC
MARATGSWLSGPASEQPADKNTSHYRGELLGLPESGVGSLASMFPRVCAMFLDWILAAGVAGLILAFSGHRISTTSSAWQLWQLLVWFVIGVLAVAAFGYTPGQYFLGLRVARVDADAPVGVVRAFVRSFMLLWFALPALFTDADGRGMHDRATGTALVRAR